MASPKVTPGLKQAKVSVTSGTKPLSRVKSANTVTSDGKLFLFGGFDEDDNLDSNVYILDLVSNQWETHRHAVYREGHSALAIGDDKILVYGGVPDDTSNLINLEFTTNELLTYNVKDHEWYPAPTLGNQVPKERSRHAACLSSDGTKMYISGGLYKDDLNDPYDDLYCYDVQTGIWDGPRKFVDRFDHSITHYKDKIWSFGGLTKEMAHVSEISWFDLRTNTTGSIVINDLAKLDGFHIYLRPQVNTALLLDIVMPLWTYDSHVEMYIGVHDIDNMTWHAILNGSFGPLLGYRWRHFFVHGSSLYLLGYPIYEDTNDTSFDYELSSIIKLELGDLGVPSTLSGQSYSGSDSSLLSSMSGLLQDQKFTDFQIIGVEGDQRPSMDSVFLENTQLEQPFNNDPRVNKFFKSSPLNVHKTILLARWPHFQRIIESGMAEARTNTLFIPEPISWLRALISFLYTDLLNASDIDIVTGLLILSSLYELPKLRHLCLESIYSRGFKIKDVLKVWKRAKLINDEVLAHNSSTFCFVNWGLIVRTRQFKELTKDELIALCQEVQRDSIIASIGPYIPGKHTNTPNLSANSSDALLPNNDQSYAYSRYNYFTGLSGAPLYHDQGAVEKDNNDEDAEEVSEEDENLEVLSTDRFRARLGTPQTSIYLSNPQSALSSLGERRNDDDEDEEEEQDTDME
jgi:hypothetical protein